MHCLFPTRLYFQPVLNLVFLAVSRCQVIWILSYSFNLVSYISEVLKLCKDIVVITC